MQKKTMLEVIKMIKLSEKFCNGIFMIN